MTSFRCVTVCSTALLLILLGLASPAPAEGNWPAWRGPDNSGVAPEGNPPTEWSETKNVKWKVPLPGSGQSTPVIWGEKLFILAASEKAGTEAWNFDVVCLDRNTGKTLWQKTAATEIPQEGHHPTGSFAPYSAVTDGTHVWAGFGSRGLHCYDLDGGHVWTTPLMKMSTRRGFGEGSSPALAGDLIIVVQDHEGPSRIAAYDKKTGELRWEKARDEITSWSTPFAVEADGITQIVVNATNRIRSYNAANGDLIWECGGMTVNVIPTPVAGFGNVYSASGFRGAALTAIDLKSKGDVTDKPVWNIDNGTPYVPSPLLYGERIYFLDGMNPKLSCANAKTGELYFARESLEGLGRVYASPVGAGGHVYVADRDGIVAVLADDSTFKVLRTNKLDDGFDASPVVIGDTLYLKGNEYLYCIAAS